MSTPLHPTFEQAREDETLRQAYLDTLLPQCSDSVSAIIYDPLLDRLEEYLQDAIESGYSPAELRKDRATMAKSYIMFAIQPIPQKFGRREKQRIVTTKFAFENSDRFTSIESHFVSGVLDHEAVHTRDFMRGIPLADGTMINYRNFFQLREEALTSILELRAYRVQLDQLRKKRITDSEEGKVFESTLERYLNFYTNLLREINPRTTLEERAREEYLSQSEP